MTIRVQTEYLRGYAARLEHNADLALEQLAAYVQAHCFDTTGLDGALEVARPSVTTVAQSVLSLVHAAQRGLRHTAANLRQTADYYDRTDWGNAERIWTAGIQEYMPGTWHEADVPSAGPLTSGGALLDLTPPVFTPEIGEVADAIGDTFSFVISVIKKATGYDVMAELGPVLLGDWGALHRLAGAYREVEEAWRAVAADVAAGMDVLSEHWDSSPGGALGASRAFDHHIRARWMTALDALAEQADAWEQTCESMALMYEHTVKSIIFMVQVYLERVGKLIKKLMTVRSLKQFAEAMWDVVVDLGGLVKDAVELAIAQATMFAEGFESSVAMIRTIENDMNEDFGVLLVGR